MTVSLKAMTYFTTALRHGNIAKAAAELNIAASAVSTAIDQVEAAFRTLAGGHELKWSLRTWPIRRYSSRVFTFS